MLSAVEGHRRSSGAPSRMMVGISAALLAVGACTDEDLPPPQHLPFRFEPVREFQGGAPSFFDLDGDGLDEALYMFEPSGRRPGNRTSLMIRTHEGRGVDQLNYVGFVHRPQVLDLDDDGRLEIFVPVVRNDTLHLSVADAAGNKLFGFPLATGKARMEPEGELPWDPEVRGLQLLDVDGDGARELVSVIVTGFARYPRGIFVHGLPEGELLDSLTLGAGLDDHELVEFERGVPGVLLSSYASDNGAMGRGFDDRHAYALAVELAPSLRIRWSRNLGDIGDRVRIRMADFTGDGARDLLIIATDARRSRLELANPRTGVPFRTSLHPPLRTPLLADWDEDGDPETIAIQRDSQVVVLGPTLAVERTVRLPLPVVQLREWTDMDGDGRGELIATGSRRHLVLRHDDLALGGYVVGDRPFQLFRRGPGQPLLVTGVVGRHRGFALVRNWWSPVHRFAPPVAAAAGPLVLLLLVGAFLRARKRGRVHQAIAGALSSDGMSGILLLDRRGRIKWAGGRVTRPSEDGDPSSNAPRSTEALRSTAPALAAFCRDLLESDVLEPVRTHLETAEGGPLQVHAQPMRLGTGSDPHWVVRCRPGPGSELEMWTTWPLLARRVAHDIKNPLSGILLTLDRMRSAVLDQAPEVGDTMDSYANRVEERIEQLRRMSSNFLKFVDSEEADRRRSDLGEVVRKSMITVSQTVPDDIRIRLKLTEDRVPVSLDRDQFHSVVENLVMNAVNAMQEGGTLVVRTDLARSLLLDPEEGPRDYGVLEVRDTGIGIRSELLPRLFDAGFSTSEEGWGLGLTIAHKIVEDHGGTLSVESEEGTGTVFTVRLPLASDGETPVPKG